MEEGEIDRVELRKRVKNTIKDMSGTIHHQYDKTLKWTHLCSQAG